MLNRVLTVVALVAALPLLTVAHGPSRLKVTASVEIAAPADAVWARVSKFDDASWIPAVAKTEAAGGNAVGATRVLTLKGDGSPTVEEELVKFDATARLLQYKITRVDPKVLPVTNYASTITVEDHGASSTLNWKAGFYRGYPNNDPPPELNDDASEAAVKGLYTSTLEALKQSFETK